MKQSFAEKMNFYGQNRTPFLFILDFELKKPLIIPLAEASKNNIFYSIEGRGNYNPPSVKPPHFDFRKFPLSFQRYKKSFDQVMNHIRYGNSFLTNLTFPTEISTNLSLEQIFIFSNAPYRLLVKNEFVVFSPELFVRIRNRKISSFPMKGTIDASIPNAKAILLNDPKEIAEHNTIVDLIRNDLSIVADNVTVEKFRYLDEVISHEKKLLQVSSSISGLLPDNYHENLGDIFNKLLPAGSICGAPKAKTVEIIRDSEIDARGYYSGIFGVYNGTDLDSAVMIRYIEDNNGKFIYRSGGGITVFSDPEKEYRELIDKVYLPIL